MFLAPWHRARQQAQARDRPRRDPGRGRRPRRRHERARPARPPRRATSPTSTASTTATSPRRTSTPALEQAAAQLGPQGGAANRRPPVPALARPGDAEPDPRVWVEGEAADRGITVTQDDIDAELAQIKEQSFKQREGVQPVRRASKFTQEDVHEQVKLTLLRDQLESEIVDEHADGLRRRDRGLLRRQHRQLQAARPAATCGHPQLLEAKVEQAKQALEADDSDADWKKVASEVLARTRPRRTAAACSRASPRVRATPSSRPGVRRRRGRARRPVQDRPRLLPDPGDQDHPGRRPSRSSRRAQQIKQQLVAAQQQQIASDFQTDFFDKWTARTICAPEATIELCSNFDAPEAEPVHGQPTRAAGRLDQADRAGHATITVDGTAAQGLPQALRRAAAPAMPPPGPSSPPARFRRPRRRPPRPAPTGAPHGRAAGGAGAPPTGAPPGRAAPGRASQR